jgi:hypothetical protein
MPETYSYFQVSGTIVLAPRLKVGFEDFGDWIGVPENQVRDLQANFD